MRTPLGGVSGFVFKPVGGLVAFGGGMLFVLAMGQASTLTVLEPLCATLDRLGDETTCKSGFGVVQDPSALVWRVAVLMGALCAMPFLIFQLARLLAPTLSRANPRGVLPFAWAGGLLAGLGAAFAIFYEAPAAFAPVLIQFAEMTGSGDLTDLSTNYAQAALVMAGSYAATLQLPVLGIMMIKSLRTRRAIQAEGAP